jgi:hypothetical protein
MTYSSRFVNCSSIESTSTLQIQKFLFRLNRISRFGKSSSFRSWRMCRQKQTASGFAFFSICSRPYTARFLPPNSRDAGASTRGAYTYVSAASLIKGRLSSFMPSSDVVALCQHTLLARSPSRQSFHARRAPGAVLSVNCRVSLIRCSGEIPGCVCTIIRQRLRSYTRRYLVTRYTPAAVRRVDCCTARPFRRRQ